MDGNRSEACVKIPKKIFRGVQVGGRVRVDGIGELKLL